MIDSSVVSQALGPVLLGLAAFVGLLLLGAAVFFLAEPFGEWLNGLWEKIRRRGVSEGGASWTERFG